MIHDCNDVDFTDLYLGPEARGVGVERIIYSPDDLISLSLEYYDEWVYLHYCREFDETIQYLL